MVLAAELDPKMSVSPNKRMMGLHHAVLRAEGPQPDLQPRAMQAHDDDVAEIVVTAMDEAASMDVEEMTREVVRRVEQHPIAWTEFKKVLIMLRDGNVEHDAAMFGVTVPLLQEVLRRLAQPTTWNAHYPKHPRLKKFNLSIEKIQSSISD